MVAEAHCLCRCSVHCSSADKGSDNTHATPQCFCIETQKHCGVAKAKVRGGILSTSTAKAGWVRDVGTGLWQAEVFHVSQLPKNAGPVLRKAAQAKAASTSSSKVLRHAMHRLCVRQTLQAKHCWTSTEEQKQRGKVVHLNRLQYFICKSIAPFV